MIVSFVFVFKSLLFFRFVVLQLFLVPSLSSFRSSSTPEEDLNILQQPFVATIVCVFCLFPSVLHCLLALFGPVDHIFSKNFMVRDCCVYHCICNGGVCNPVVYAPISHYSKCSTTGVTETVIYAVRGMVHVKYSLLLIFVRIL